MGDNGKCVAETTPHDDDHATHERRFWQTYFAIIEQRMKHEKEQEHEKTENTT